MEQRTISSDPARYRYSKTRPNEIAIPKSALGMPTTVNIRISITYGNGVPQLESVTLVPEFATLAIPVLSLLGFVFCMRRKERK